MMVACIAETIHKSRHAHAPEGEPQAGRLMMEVPFWQIREWSNANARRGRRPEILRDGHRADLVLFNGSDRPICVIEAKRQWRRRPCLKDLDRLHGLVGRLAHRNGGSLRRGFLPTTVVRQGNGHRPAKDRVGDQVESIRRDVRQHFDGKRVNWSLSPSPTFFSDGWAWASLCVGVSARNRQADQ